MHGLGFLLLNRRERVSAFVTAMLCFISVPFVAGEPQRKIVDGQEVVEAVLLGHVIPTWAFFAIFLSFVGALWFGVHRLLDRLWPAQRTIVVDKDYERVEGGYVAWKGDGPDAGSPLDYALPRLRTALDYLQAEEPASMRVLVLGEEGAEEELRAYGKELSRWLEEATEDELNDLIPSYRSMSHQSSEATWRLAEAHDERGIPSLLDLQALVEETGDDALREYVIELRDRT